VNFVVPRDFGGGLDFLAKAKATEFGLKAKAKV